MPILAARAQSPSSHPSLPHSTLASSSGARCVFESYCAMIVVGLEASSWDSQRGRNRRGALAPKLIDAESGEAVPIDWPPEPQEFAQKLQQARFTGKGDREEVEGQYLRYYLSVGVGGRATAELSSARRAASRNHFRVRAFALSVALPIMVSQNATHTPRNVRYCAFAAAASAAAASAAAASAAAASCCRLRRFVSSLIVSARSPLALHPLPTSASHRRSAASPSSAACSTRALPPRALCSSSWALTFSSPWSIPQVGSKPNPQAQPDAGDESRPARVMRDVPSYSHTPSTFLSPPVRSVLAQIRGSCAS